MSNCTQSTLIKFKPLSRVMLNLATKTYKKFVKYEPKIMNKYECKKILRKIHMH